MRRIPILVRFLWPTLFVPLSAYAAPQQSGQSDCKSLITHSGFAEFVMPNEGGTQKLPIKVDPAVKWTVYNTDYIDWIEILRGDSGTGPGAVTVQLGVNTGKYCRVGVLTISGVQLFFGTARRIGSPIRILQPGTKPAEGEEQPKPSLPAVIDLGPTTGKNPQPATSWIKK